LEEDEIIATGRCSPQFGFIIFSASGSLARPLAGLQKAALLFEPGFLFEVLIMSFKMYFNKYRENEKAQSIIEYVVMFAVMIAALLVVFGLVNPDWNMGTMFHNAVTRALGKIEAS
jgi:hypothetical protein